MPLVRNKPLADCLDFEASIRHYQDLNHQIEQQTTAVFDMVNRLNNSKNSENSQYAEKSKTEVLDQFKESSKNTSSDATVAVPRAATRDKPDIFILVSVSFLISVSPNLIGHVFVLLRIAGVVVLGMFYMEVSYVSLTSVN